MTRCAGCYATLDPAEADPDHPKHVWLVHGAAEPWCRPCWRTEAARRDATGDWPAERTAA